MQTITKVYDTYDKARSAVGDLETAGIPMADISVLANQESSQGYDDDADQETEAGPGAGLGAVVGGTAGLLTGLGLMAIPGLGPVVAAGWLTTTALGAVAGGATGGIVGSLIGSGVTEDNAHIYSEAVRRGGTLVTVRHDQPNGKIADILNASDPIDPITRRNEYSQEGWKQFDPKAPAYQPDQAEIERMRRSSN